MSTFQARTFRGDRLREARKARGLSQTGLGEKIGAHVTSISDWERGDNAPSGRHVASLSRELGIDVDSFYADPDDEEDRDLLTDLALAVVTLVEYRLKRAQELAEA